MCTNFTKDLALKKIKSFIEQHEDKGSVQAVFLNARISSKFAGGIGVDIDL